MISPRKHAKSAPLQPWAQRTPTSDLKDRDGWPIRLTAKVACRRNGSLWSGEVIDTYLDYRDRPVVEVRTESGKRAFRPGEVRVQRR